MSAALLQTLAELGHLHVSEVARLTAQLEDTGELLREATHKRADVVHALDNLREELSQVKINLGLLEKAHSQLEVAKSEGDRQLSHSLTAEARLVGVIREAHGQLAKARTELHDADQQAPLGKPPGPHELAIETALDQLDEVLNKLTEEL